MRNPLHALCPYFAMFPETFVRKHVAAHTRSGALVFDCFSGRGTTLLESLLADRDAIALDVNPVAYCVSAAKAHVPEIGALHDRIDDLDSAFARYNRTSLVSERRELPAFFGRAFHHATLDQLLFLRRLLNWRGSTLDCFVAALALGALHGEMGKPMEYFSNQMPRTISTKPAYSLNYWRTHGLWPHNRDVFDVLRSRAELRLSGVIPARRGHVVLGDARRSAARFRRYAGQVAAIITSPPYYDVTAYEEDQWLRLWFLGFPARVRYQQISRDDRYESKVRYWKFLAEVWEGVAPLMRPSAVLVCRLGAKGISVDELTAGLLGTARKAFRGAGLIADPLISSIRRRQTDSFRPGSRGCLFEVDYVVGT